MNLLKTFTLPTDEPDTYLVYWTNSVIQPKGIIRVRVRHEIADRPIVAELAAMRYLLEDKGVVGNSVIGSAGTRLIVSTGAIKKLRAMKSNKSHLAPYANFLVTRFADSPVSVDKDTRWFDSILPTLIEDLLVGSPSRETLNIAGVGKVSITQHVLERIADRVLPPSDRSARMAWKKLVQLVSDSSLHEVSRRSLWAGANHSRSGRQEGRYFLSPRGKLILVITDTPNEGRRLVTTYPATQHFQPIHKAA